MKRKPPHRFFEGSAEKVEPEAKKRCDNWLGLVRSPDVKSRHGCENAVLALEGKGREDRLAAGDPRPQERDENSNTAIAMRTAHNARPGLGRANETAGGRSMRLLL